MVTWIPRPACSFALAGKKNLGCLKRPAAKFLNRSTNVGGVRSRPASGGARASKTVRGSWKSTDACEASSPSPFRGVTTISEAVSGGRLWCIRGDSILLSTLAPRSGRRLIGQFQAGCGLPYAILLLHAPAARLAELLAAARIAGERDKCRAEC